MKQLQGLERFQAPMHIHQKIMIVSYKEKRWDLKV